MQDEFDRAEELLQLPPEWSDWTVTEEIGEGSFGKVYVIEKDGEEHALKVISVPASDSESGLLLLEMKSEEAAWIYLDDLVNNFTNEINVMYSLKDDPHIVRIEDHLIVKDEGKLGYRIFIRMELLTSLQEHFTENLVREGEVIRLGLDICDALISCDEHKIIHRDIKKENIFISDDGCFKLGDFGTARQLDMTFGTFSAKGTYSYMAPEVLKGERYNKQVDIYSLGLVLFRLLNRNKEPFIDPDVPIPLFREREEAQQRRVEGEILPDPVDASPALSLVIHKACAYLAKDRYPDAAAFKEALQKVLDGSDDFDEERKLKEAEHAALSAGTSEPDKSAGSAAGAGISRPRRKGAKALAPLLIGVVLICGAGGYILTRTGIIGGNSQTENEEQLSFPLATEDGEAGVIPAREAYDGMDEDMKNAMEAAGQIMEETSVMTMAQYEEFASYFDSGDETLLSEYFQSFRKYGNYDRHIYSAVGSCVTVDEENPETLYYIGISGYNSVSEDTSSAAASEQHTAAQGSISDEKTGEESTEGTGEEAPETLAEYPWILCLKYTDDGWIIDAEMSARDMAWVQAKEVLDAVPAGYMREDIVNRAPENRDSYSYLDDEAVYDWVATAEVKFVWQDEEGNVYVTIVLRNGTDDERTFSGGHLVLNDTDLGTVAEFDLPTEETVEPGKNIMHTYRIDSEFINTGTEPWVYINEVLQFEGDNMNLHEMSDEAEEISTERM